MIRQYPNQVRSMHYVHVHKLGNGNEVWYWYMCFLCVRFWTPCQYAVFPCMGVRYIKATQSWVPRVLKLELFYWINEILISNKNKRPLMGFNQITGNDRSGRLYWYQLGFSKAFSKSIGPGSQRVCLVSQYHERFPREFAETARPGVGVTKAPFVNFSASKIFDLAKVPFRLFESHSYLTGVTAAELRRHLPNINVIFNS